MGKLWVRFDQEARINTWAPETNMGVQFHHLMH